MRLWKRIKRNWLGDDDGYSNSESTSGVSGTSGSTRPASDSVRVSTEAMAPRAQGTAPTSAAALSARGSPSGRPSRTIDLNKLDSLGELALQAKVVNPSTLREALAYQKRNPRLKIGQILVALKMTRPEFVEALVKQQQALRSGKAKDVVQFAEYVKSLKGHLS